MNRPSLGERSAGAPSQNESEDFDVYLCSHKGRSSQENLKLIATSLTQRGTNRFGIKLDDQNVGFGVP